LPGLSIVARIRQPSGKDPALLVMAGLDPAILFAAIANVPGWQIARLEACEKSAPQEEASRVKPGHDAYL